MPLMNTRGTNTATVVNEELSIGVIISDVPLSQARMSVSPFCRYWVMFSVTITELSIIMPTARISPESEMMLSDTWKR